MLRRIERSRHRSRRAHIATSRRFLGTLFHHALAAPRAIDTISISVIETTVFAALMTASTLAKILSTCVITTRARTVPVAMVTPRAEEEDLTATAPCARDESQRLHIPERGTGENLIDRPGSCDLPKHDYVPVVEGSVLIAPGLHFVVPRRDLIELEARDPIPDMKTEIGRLDLKIKMIRRVDLRRPSTRAAHCRQRQ